MYGETKVWLHALPIGKKYLIHLVQEVLELNSNYVRLIPDDYRATSMDTLIGMSETLSW
jgi:hypothetical protein